MNYVGPECFRDTIESCWNLAKAHMTRKEPPGILAGDLVRIQTGPRGRSLKVDPKSTDSIDDKVGILFQPWPNAKAAEGAYEDVLAACTAATILPPGESAAYDPTLDVVFLSPWYLFQYLIAAGTPSHRVFAIQEPVAIEEYARNLDVPFDFLCAIFEWDLGSSHTHRTLQRLVGESGFEFDKSRDGRYNFDFCSLARKSSSAEGLALCDHYEKMARLRLFEFEEIVSRLCANRILPVHYQSPPADMSLEALQKLSLPSQRLGIGQFLRNAKHVEDISYAQNRDVFELI